MSGGRSRREIADWANSISIAEDRGELDYIPQVAEDSIWDAVLYLIGIDLEDQPGNYLFAHADFNRFWSEWQKRVASIIKE